MKHENISVKEDSLRRPNSLRGDRKGGDGGMWKLKSCPRCNGDVFLEEDISGWYLRCLQCGYNRDLKDIVRVNKGTPGKKKEPVLQR